MASVSAFTRPYSNESYWVAFRKKIYRSLEELEMDLEAWLQEYNEQRPIKNGDVTRNTPRQTFIESVPLTKEKMRAP